MQRPLGRGRVKKEEVVVNQGWLVVGGWPGKWETVVVVGYKRSDDSIQSPQSTFQKIATIHKDS